MVERISIICPNCRTKLSIFGILGWQEKLIECPHCKFKAKANVYQSGIAAQGGQGADDDPTQLPEDFRPGQNSVIGVIKVLSTGRCFQLKEGTNVLGRVAKTGTADLKISTDPFMSRRHLQVDVVKTAKGIEHRLVEIDSKNIIILNGRPIQRGDVLKLKFGDHMVLGRSEVVFDCPTPSDEEATDLV